MIPVPGSVGRSSFIMDVSVCLIQVVMFGCAPLEDQLVGDNIDLLEEAVPDPDYVCVGYEARRRDRIDLVDCHHSGALGRDGHLV